VSELPAGTLVCRTIETPLGHVAVAASANGVRAISLPARTPEAARAEVARIGRGCLLVDGEHEHLDRAITWVADYFAGRPDPGPLTLDLDGATPFQRAVWERLLAIPRGGVTTYLAIAVQLGRGPTSARAVGSAVGSNHFPLYVPCHRVVGSDGSLTGFAGGLPMKRALLELEGALPAEPRLL